MKKPVPQPISSTLPYLWTGATLANFSFAYEMHRSSNEIDHLSSYWDASQS